MPRRRWHDRRVVVRPLPRFPSPLFACTNLISSRKPPPEGEPQHRGAKGPPSSRLAPSPGALKGQEPCDVYRFPIDGFAVNKINAPPRAPTHDKCKPRGGIQKKKSSSSSDDDCRVRCGGRAPLLFSKHKGTPRPGSDSCEFRSELFAVLA
jgi:hypothetical protein